jgi:hypothetical protein
MREGRVGPERNETHLDFTEFAANAATAASLFPNLRQFSLAPQARFAGVPARAPSA